MESLIDNCWQFRSRQLLDTDYEILMSSLFTRTIGTIRGNVSFKLNGIPLDFHLSKKKRYCFNSYTLSYMISFLSLERFLETLHFNYPGPDKRNHGSKINFSIPYLPFVLFPIFARFFTSSRRRGSKGNVGNHPSSR